MRGQGIVKSNQDTTGFADTQLADDSPSTSDTLDASGAPIHTPGLAAETPRGGPFLAGGPGRYQVIAEHARGGLGRVIKARDQHLGRIVAIKELLAPSDLAQSLFVREALITARLQHPGIVPVIEAGRWPSGEPFYVMKLVSGQPLQDLIRRRVTLAERLALLPNAIAVVETIAYAHSQGVIHRDIKPANVIVGEFGETVVVDWGLARHLDSRAEQPARATAGSARSSAAPGATQASDHTWRTPDQGSVSGKVIGTPAYMSPEQARGHDVDERADVYALGALLYDLLTGKPPYAGSRAILDQVLAGPPRPLAEHGERIPPDLVTIADKAMARDAADRYPTAKELADDLKRYQTGQLVSAHQYSTWTLLRRWVGRHRSAVLVALAGLLVLTATGVIGMRRIMVERNIARAQRAHALVAREQAEQGRNRLLLLQAESALAPDPTATLAWLKRAPLDGDRLFQARNLYDEAMARGVARHVFAHGEWPLDIAFSPDGERVVSVTADGVLRLLDVTTGDQRILARSPRTLAVVAMSPDGKLVAAGDEEGLIHVWSLAGDAGRESPWTLRGHAGRPFTLRFIDSERLLSVGGDDTCRVWNAVAATEVSTLAMDGAQAYATAGHRIALGFAGGDVAIFDLDTDAEPWRITLPEPARVMHLSADARRLATKSASGRVDLLDVPARTITYIGQVPDPYYKPFLALSPQGRWLATMGESWSIYLWDLGDLGDPGDLGTEPDMVPSSARVLRGHEDGIHELAFSADEMWMISASDDGSARLWDLVSDSVQVLRGHADDVSAVEIGPRGNFAATASVDGSVRVWPLRTSSSRSFRGHGNQVSSVRFLGPDTLLSTDHDGELRTWSLSSGASRLVARSAWVRWDGKPSVSPDGRFVATPDPAAGTIEIWDPSAGTRQSIQTDGEPLTTLAVAPEGAAVAATSKSGRILVWSIDQSESTTLKHEGTVCGMVWSPDGSSLVVVSPFRAELWDMVRRTRELDLARSGTTGKCGETVFQTPAAFSRDSAWLALPGPHDGMMLWHLPTGSMRMIDTHPYGITDLTFSPDGSRLVAGLYDRSLRMWNTKSGQERRLGSHGDLILKLVFSPDGQRLASASYDGELRLWDLATGSYRSLHGHDAGIFAIDISADGTWLAAGSRDRTIRLWNIGEDPTPDAATLRARLDQGTSAVIDAEGHHLYTP